MRYKAIFFDRDGTLTYFDKEKEQWRDTLISQWSGKPSPVIFNAALRAQGVSSRESLYVDDCKPEADGAREQGFTSFFIDRSGHDTDTWSIQNLKQLIDFVEG